MSLIPVIYFYINKKKTSVNSLHFDSCAQATNAVELMSETETFVFASLSSSRLGVCSGEEGAQFLLLSPHFIRCARSMLIASPCPPSNHARCWRRKQLLKVAHNLKTLRHVGAMSSPPEMTSKLYPPSPERHFSSIKMEQKCALPALIGGDLEALLRSRSTPPSSTSHVSVKVNSNSVNVSSNGVNVEVFPANEGSIGSEQDAQLLLQLIVEQYIRPPMFPRLLWKKVVALVALDSEGCKTTAPTSSQSKHGGPIRKEDMRKAMYCIIHGGQQRTADVDVSAVCSMVKEQLDDEAVASLREHFVLMWDTFSGLAEERVMKQMGTSILSLMTISCFFKHVFLRRAFGCAC
jgi:hypothetical protein